MNKSDASEVIRAADPSIPAVSSETSSLKNRYHAAECGKRIRHLRKGRGLTQEKLAEQLHLGTDHIGKVETGKHRCSLELLIDIAEFFDCSLDYLILGKADLNHDVRQKLGLIIEELNFLKQKL